MVEGDKQAFRYFFDKYYKDLCNFVNIYLKDEMAAEEVVQDIFVYFWENKHKIQIQTSVKAYLFGASKFKSLNVLRSQKNHASWFEPLTHNEQFVEEIKMDQISSAEEFRSILNDAIMQLPEKCRRITSYNVCYTKLLRFRLVPTCSWFVLSSFPYLPCLPFRIMAVNV